MITDHLGAHNQDKVVKVQEPLPNRLIKQQQEVVSKSIFSHLLCLIYKVLNISQYYKAFIHIRKYEYVGIFYIFSKYA